MWLFTCGYVVVAYPHCETYRLSMVAAGDQSLSAKELQLTVLRVLLVLPSEPITTSFNNMFQDLASKNQVKQFPPSFPTFHQAFRVPHVAMAASRCRRWPLAPLAPLSRCLGLRCFATRDAYSVMGLDRSATAQEVKERFRTLAKPPGGILGENCGVKTI